MTTTLKITASATKEPDRDSCVREIVRPPICRVLVTFALCANGLEACSYHWNMEARQRDDDQAELRRELLASTWWEFSVSGDVYADPRNIQAIEIDDPHGLLEWLCPGQDLKDYFNQLHHEKKQISDKPLRLPA
jgi:hypothetical protein